MESAGVDKHVDRLGRFCIHTFLRLPAGMRATILEYASLLAYTGVLFLYFFMIDQAPDYTFVPLLLVLSVAMMIYIYTDFIYDLWSDDKTTEHAHNSDPVNGQFSSLEHLEAIEDEERAILMARRAAMSEDEGEAKRYDIDDYMIPDGGTDDDDDDRGQIGRASCRERV